MKPKRYPSDLTLTQWKRLKRLLPPAKPGGRPRQVTWCGVYLHGLLTDGERKNIEPMAQRLARRIDRDVADPDQALHSALAIRLRLIAPG
jgi:hypothetical protein